MPALRNYYQIELRHDGLHKHRVIRGADRYIVEAAAITQKQAWAEQYAKKIAIQERQRQRESKQQAFEENVDEAQERSTHAEHSLSELRGILAATLKIDDRVDWAELMQPPFPQPKPKERHYLTSPPEPIFNLDEWKHNRSFVTAMVPFLAKRAEAAARAEYNGLHSKWEQRCVEIQSSNEAIYAENLRAYEDWNRRATAYEEARSQHNSSVELAKEAYQSLNADAILDYCEMVLSRSKYPDCLPKEFELEYRPALRTILVEYQLPAPEDLPRLASVKYSKAKDEFTETELTKKEFEQLYSDVVFQTAIRTVHELIEADVVRGISAVILNGNVTMLNPGTGNKEDRCILSLRVERQAFESINLSKVDSRACFDSLGGIAGTKMADCCGVKPFDCIDRTDERFTDAKDVSGTAVAGLDQWNELTKGLIDPQDIKFVELGTIAMLLGFPPQEKFSAALSRELTEAIVARGFALEPDARFGAPSYRSEEEIALFVPLNTPVTPAYLGSAALQQLCVIVATADENPTDEELGIARQFIMKNAMLTSQEHQRLHVLEKYFCRNPESAKRALTRLVKRLTNEQRPLIAEVLVCVAAADGVITTAEWRALDRLAKMLEISQASFHEILCKLGVNFDEPSISEAQPAAPGEAIPAPVEIAPTFTLDMERVASISKETSEVISLLSKVMSEEEPVETHPAATPSPTGGKMESDWLDSLEEKYRVITRKLIERSKWPRSEFQQLAAEFKMLPLGVVDALNEWSDEYLGEFLIEGEDPLCVNQSILPEQL